MSFEEEFPSLKNDLCYANYLPNKCIVVRISDIRLFCFDKEKVELIKNVIMNEAFMIGRIYSATGEKETPAEINDILEKKCSIRIKEELGL